MPVQAIADGWEEGQHVTSVTGSSHGYWTVVMSSRSGYEDQAHSDPSSTWPSNFVRESWDGGKDITEVAYCNGTWLVVTSGGTNFPQRYGWATPASLSAKIQEYRTLGYHITDVAHGGGSWVVVGSKVASFGDQVYTTSSTFPWTFISDSWRDGYDMTELYYGDGTWVVVMTKLTSSPGQAFANWDTIEDHWDEGRQVFDAVYNGSTYWFPTTQSLGEVLGFPPPSGGVLKSNVTRSSSRSATFTLDVFVVGSDSELLSLGDTDFSIDDGELGTDRHPSGLQPDWRPALPTAKCGPVLSDVPARPEREHYGHRPDRRAHRRCEGVHSQPGKW